MPVLKLSSMRFFVLSILISLAGCQRAALSPQEYVRYVQDPDNGLRIEKKINDIVFTAQYEPVDYLLLRDVSTSVGQINEAREESDDTEYFVLRIGSAGRGPLIEKKDDLSRYNARLDYCNMLMQKDVVLVKGNDTIPCGMFQFERNFGMTSYNNFLLGFIGETPASQSAPQDMTLIFYDGLFNSGAIKLRIDAEDLKRIPKLKMI